MLTWRRRKLGMLDLGRKEGSGEEKTSGEQQKERKERNELKRGKIILGFLHPKEGKLTWGLALTVLLLG